MCLCSCILTYPNLIGKIVMAGRAVVRERTSEHHLQKVFARLLHAVMVLMEANCNESNAWQHIIGMLFTCSRINSEGMDILSMFGSSDSMQTMVDWLRRQGPSFRAMMETVWHCLI
jgi:hypothetical protein